MGGVICLALVAVSGGVWMDARRTGREIPRLEEGLVLLELEREAGAAAARLGLASIEAAFLDPDHIDLPDQRREVAARLRRVEPRLEALPTHPSWSSTVHRLQETLGGGIRRMESPDPLPEGAWAWQWSFATAFSGIFPTDLSGRWSALMSFALESQYAIYAPVSIAELVLARWAEDGGPLAADAELRAYIEGERGRLEHLGADSLLDPFHASLDVAAARDVGTEHGYRVSRLRADPAVRTMAGWYAGLVDPASEAAEPAGPLEDRDPAALFAATRAALDVLEGGAIDLLALAATELDEAAHRSRLRAFWALVMGGATAFFGLGLAGHWVRTRVRLEAELRRAAEQDPLTGVHSRFSLFHNDEPRLARGDTKGVALLLTDMDDFKSINDRWGHRVGDGALREFARACTRVVGEGDRVARIGGDEFVILLHDRDDPVQAAAVVAERIHAALADPVVIDGHRLHLRATIGMAVGRDVISIDDLLLQADTALLEAKKSRRSRHALFSRNHRRNLIREIDAALETGAIDPVFQPIVRSSDFSLAGTELLARWTRDDGSQVPLRALLDVLASVGAGGAWTERMLLAAARVAPFLPSRTMRFWLNVAAHDLVGPGARSLLDGLMEGPVPATRLGIEITERIPPADLPEARSTLLTLRASGLEIALDDVGSDGVPLRHLTELPLDRVKLDGSLVRGLDRCGAQRSLLTGIVTSATDLGLEIVAEQVETDEEVEALIALGVHYLQGYRTGAPVTIETFIAAARREEPRITRIG